MHKKILFVITFIFITIDAKSQALVSLTGAGIEHDTQAWLSRNSLRNFNEPDGFVGEIYFGGDWLLGALTTIDGLTLENTKIRYDLRNDQLAAQLNGVKFIVKPNSVRNFSVVHNGETFVFETSTLETTNTYLQLLHNGNVKLYTRHTVKKLAKDLGNQAYGSGVAYDKYVRLKTYYALINDSLTLFKPVKKSIYEVLAPRAEDLKRFIKESKPQLKTDQGLVILFEYYDQLSK